MDIFQFWSLYQHRVSDWFVTNYYKFLGTIISVESKLRSELEARYFALLKVINENYSALLGIILAYYGKALTEIQYVKTELMVYVSTQIILAKSELVAKIYGETTARLISENEILFKVGIWDKEYASAAKVDNEVMLAMLQKEYLWLEQIKRFIIVLNDTTGQTYLKQYEWMVKDGAELLMRMNKNPEYFFAEFWSKGFIDYLTESLGYALGSEETELPAIQAGKPPYPHQVLEDIRYG